MAVATTTDFWKLLLDSHLISKEDGKHLHDQFKVQADSQANAKTLAKWLVQSKAITQYQAKVLLAGKPGPFLMGSYIIEDRLDQGAFHGNYLARHAQSGHRVQLQYVPKPIADDPNHWPVVESQCHARCGNTNPHLLRCFEIVDIAGKHFLATENLSGNPLNESRPGPGQPIPSPDCARLGRQVALGIAALHQQGMTHGHLNSSHLWLQPSGNLKVLHSPLEMNGPINWGDPNNAQAMLAVADYAAPELAQPGSVPNTLTDIYALGCILYDLLTGNPPYQGGDIQQKLTRHANEPIATPDYIPQPMLQVISYMMAKNPSVRYQRMEDVVEALAAFVDPNHLNAPAEVAEPTLVNYINSLPQYPATAVSAEPVAPAMPATPVAQPATPVAPAAPQMPPMAQPPVQAQPAMAMPAQPQAMPQQVAAPAMGVPQATIPQATMPQPGYGNTQAMPATAVGVGGGKSSALAERMRKRKMVRKITNLVILSVLAIGLCIGGYYAISINNDDPIEPDPDPNVAVTPDPKPNTEPDTPTNVDTGPKIEVVAGDDTLLWNSPTSGEPLTLEGMPPGTKAVLSVRLAELISSPQGERVLRGLGPKFLESRQSWEAATGFRFDQVDRLSLGFSNATQPGQPCIVVTLKSPANFTSVWGNPAALGMVGQQYYKVNGWAMYPLPTSNGNGFSMSSEQIIQQVASNNGTASSMGSRELEQLRKLSDADRTVNLLIDPNFIAQGGAQLFPGQMAAMQPEVEWFFSTGIQAACMSADLDELLYLEGRYYGSLDNEPAALANTMKQRISEVVQKLSSRIDALNATDYWSNLARKFPQMVEFAYTKSRAGTDEDNAIVNTVLPISAAQNLVVASELTLSAGTSGATASVAMNNNQNTPEPTTIPEKLKIKMSLSFPRNSLEFAMRDFGEEIGIPVKIIGGDLQLDGITRNQQISNFMQEDKTREEVLVALLINANPIKTVKLPNEADQKLVYVIAPNPEDPDAGDIILITTRSAVETKKLTLPDIFKVQ